MDSNKRILVVEDDATRVERFRAELEGYALDFVSSVEEAIGLLGGPRYDLLFLDHDLEFGARVYLDPYEPNTGYQLARHLADRVEYRRVPVVVHSFNWFGANKILKVLPNALYIPFGIYPIREIARLFLERGLDPELNNLSSILTPPPG